MNTELFTTMWERFPEAGSPLVLVMAIARSADADGVCRLTTRELAAAARMSRTSAWRLLTELQAKGWIVRRSSETKTEPETIELQLTKLKGPGEVPQPWIKDPLSAAARRLLLNDLYRRS